MAKSHVPCGHRRRPVRARCAAVLTAAGLTVATLAGGASTVGAQIDDATAAPAAGSWLAGQFVDGERFETTFDGTAYPDQGGTIDGVLALAAAGVADGTAAAATAWLAEAATTDGYIGSGGEAYAGATAKLALLAQVRGLDPTSWGEGDVDLITRLRSLEGGDGRFSDQSAFGDFSNSIGQSMAIIVLVRQPGEAPTDESIDLLLQSQCADGGFALELEPSTCTSGVDTTSYALQALLDAGRAGDGDEIDEAVAYLLAAQQDGGGFATAATGTPNANSSGLGTQGLRAAGQAAAADAGVAFIRTLQQDCDAPEGARGAIDFQAGDHDASTAVRATTQAVLGLVGVAHGELSAAGATTDRPVLECPASPTAPADGPTPVAAGPAPGGIAVAPAAVPVRANPTFTG